MKKYVLSLMLLLSAAIFFSGCAIHSGIMSDSASLSSKNFTMVKYVQGQSKTTKIFGLGGLAKNALVAEAKKDLLQNNPLREGQTLANVTVDFKTSIVFFVITTKVTVTADIAEFK